MVQNAVLLVVQAFLVLVPAPHIKEELPLIHRRLPAHPVNGGIQRPMLVGVRLLPPIPHRLPVLPVNGGTMAQIHAAAAHQPQLIHHRLPVRMVNTGIRV